VHSTVPCGPQQPNPSATAQSPLRSTLGKAGPIPSPAFVPLWVDVQVVVRLEAEIEQLIRWELNLANREEFIDANGKVAEINNLVCAFDV